MIRKSTINVLGAVLFFFLCLFGVYYLWANYMLTSVDESAYSVEEYAYIDVDKLQGMYGDIFDERTNNGNIPIPVPNDKMGNTNPFTLSN